MKNLNLYITEKFKISKDINPNYIKFPVKIKFWWARSDIHIVKDDLNLLSDIQKFGLEDLHKRDDQNDVWHLYEIEIESIDDLYEFIGCMCWTCMSVDKITIENINKIEDGIINYKEVKNEIIDKLDINRINNIYKAINKKVPI